MTDEKSEKNGNSFLHSLPALMTGVASLITALIAVLTFSVKTCHNDKKQEKPQAVVSAPAPMPGTVSEALPLGDLSSCQDITGKWGWFIGGVVTIAPDGALEWRQNPLSPAPTASGRWACTSTTPRQYLLSWPTGLTDVVTLSPDKRSLSGTNQVNARITGSRLD